VAVAGGLGMMPRAHPEPGTFLRHNIKWMRSTFQNEHVEMGASSSAPPAPEIKPPTTPVRGAMLPLHVLTSLLVTFVILFCISIEISARLINECSFCAQLARPAATCAGKLLSFSDIAFILF
jgi:hypothetical protein